MDESLLHIWAVILAILQVATLALRLTRAYRLGSWLVLASPAILLGLLLSGLATNPSYRLTSFDITFLAVDITALLLSLALLYRKGLSALFFWIAWLLNLLLCSVFVYLAFFFKLTGF